MPKAGVARFKFIKQFLHLLLELFIAVASKDLILPGVGQFLPVGSIHSRVEMLSRHQLTNAVADLFSGLKA